MLLWSSIIVGEERRADVTSALLKSGNLARIPSGHPATCGAAKEVTCNDCVSPIALRLRVLSSKLQGEQQGQSLISLAFEKHVTDFSAKRVLTAFSFGVVCLQGQG